VDATVKFHGNDCLNRTDRVTAPCKDKFYPRHHNQGRWCAFPLWSDESGFAYNRHKSQWGRWIGCQASGLTNEAVEHCEAQQTTTVSRAIFVKTQCVREYSRVSRDFHNKYRFPCNGDAVSSARQGQNFKYYSYKPPGNANTMSHRDKTIASHSNVSRISLQETLRGTRKYTYGIAYFKIGIKSILMSVATVPQTYTVWMWILSLVLLCFAPWVIQALRWDDPLSK
jgi:hypothetical protein